MAMMDAALPVDDKQQQQMMTPDCHDYVLVPLAEVQSFVERCILAVGAKPSHAKDLATLIACADHRGHLSHGLNRLRMYVQDIRSGTNSKDGEPVILKEKAGTAWVDGNNVLGPVVGTFCTDLAIKKAKESGIGIVVAKGSNHYCIAGWYAMRCADAGLVGMSFTNTSPVVVPTRARKPLIGTNPISMAAPAERGDSFVLDMATSTVAFGKVQLNSMKKEPIPKGWGTDSTGKVTTVPEDVLTSGGLMPLGGQEASGGYKGYGLSMMVEMLCGVFAGAAFGPFVRHWSAKDAVANLGQCFIAINTEAFAPGFTGRMTTLMDECRNSEPAEGETEVLVAGDPERKHMKKVDADGGVLYHRNLIQEMDSLAKDLGIEAMKSKEL
ncbi:uncharacterized oxidoreductase YjmC-like isoform X2 [Asterias rubens]|uniref:uncharacterized oxidoreductase YjmC-like isoform X2 n=1 Tax=Asterias rubens TaxID=7604 RepID=UPI001455A552|nr:uncharacterized oxidoreductase YjmC-like isoform X2 [Asterias rubens]